jgi:nitroreductase/dihydropteridine reductase
MQVLSAAQKRHTTKAYDATRRIPDDVMQQIYALLRHSPSSVNSQPWHFIVASTPDGRARMAKGAQGGYSYNEAKIVNASHVILLCARTDMDEGHLGRVLEQEQQDGRFRDDAAKAGQNAGRVGYVNLHRYARKDVPHWLEKQVYLALGTAMLGAAMLGVDTTPMEGIDQAVLDKEFGLNERGLTSVVMLSLGYHAEGDFNARLPKSRLREEQVFTFL